MKTVISSTENDDVSDKHRHLIHSGDSACNPYKDGVAGIFFDVAIASCLPLCRAEARHCAVWPSPRCGYQSLACCASWDCRPVTSFSQSDDVASPIQSATLVFGMCVGNSHTSSRRR